MRSDDYELKCVSIGIIVTFAHCNWTNEGITVYIVP